MRHNHNTLRARAAQAQAALCPPQEKRVYLVGAIGKNGWRDEIVPRFRDVCMTGDVPHLHAFNATVTVPTITDGVACSGPFFVACDHGCAHGESNHGVGAASAGCFEVLVHPSAHIRRRLVFDVSIERINRADAIFAYFDREKAYGSCWELGYAHAIGRPIFVGLSPDLTARDDYWFVVQSQAKYDSINVGNVRDLWSTFVSHI